MTKMKSNLPFDISHLDGYAIISEPGFVAVRNNSVLDFNKLYRSDGHPRWVLNLKAITEKNLVFLQSLTKFSEFTYAEVGRFLMTGALWENQITSPEDLPIKGEEMGAIFDYVKGELRCTHLSVIPRKKPRLYIHADDVYSDIKELERIIKNSK